MFLENEYSVFDFAAGISEVVDLVSPNLSEHHKKVAYISYNIATEMGLPDIEVQNILLGAILHDVGAFTSDERLEVVYALFNDNEYNGHSEMGYKLLRNFEPFGEAAALIRDHHAHYDKSSNSIAIGSHIIHLADRLSVLLDEHRELLEQVPEIMSDIERHSNIFHPDTLDALKRVSKMEYFWIEAFLLHDNTVLPDRMRFEKVFINLDMLRSLAKVIAQIIDFRSRFTSTHSSGVAVVAQELAAIFGFSERECKLMEIAGYLHDLGKLALSNDILEKSSALDHDEFNEMRKHPYYTYIVLKKIKGFEQIAMWAAYHHERLDGNGYPFHVKNENFTKLARIMAVADIVTAITENRPYRPGMDSAKAMEILYDMVNNGGIDKGTVEIVSQNFSRINAVRIEAQREAQREYDAFYSIVGKRNQ